MHRPIRTAAALAALAALIACGKGNATPGDARQTACKGFADCSGNQVCIQSACVDICHSTSECRGGTVCDEGVCLAPACGNDAQCGSGQACLGGKCATAQSAPQAASCEVTPNPGVVRASSSLQMAAVVKDANGVPLHLPAGSLSWTASNGATVGADGLLAAPAGYDGPITVTASAGSKSCTSSVRAYGDHLGMRVTVINMHTKEPVAGAKVVIGASTQALVTGADGSVTLSATAGAHDIHVFASGYGYTSFIQTASTDLLVPLAPYIDLAQRSGFTSHLCESRATDAQCPPEGEFAPLQEQGEAVHLAFFGSGVPNSLLDLSLDTLLGPLHPVTIDVPGTTISRTLNLPYGLVLGIGPRFYGTNDPRMYADGGLRALWGIGGNVNLQKVLTVLAPLLQPGATVDAGALLPQLLGFFGKLQAGAVAGVKAPPNGRAPSFVAQPIALTTPMRLRIDATSPTLPKLDGAYLDGVIAVAGAADFPLGFVPLGITAGVSAGDGQGNVLDPGCDTAGTTPCATNKLPIRLAPLNGGTEGSDVAVALLALNFGGLAPGSTGNVALSGQVTVLPNRELTYAAPGTPAPAIAPPPFMKLPATSSVVVTRSTRDLSVTGDADAVHVYRFELENAARLTWNVWMPPLGSGSAQRDLHLPDPHAIDPALVDPFADAIGSDGLAHPPSARLLALQLAGAPSADALEAFPGTLHLDELGKSLRAFTALQVTVNP